MKNIEVITTEQLMEDYQQTKNFVVRHAKKMGGRRGRFDRVLVEQFLSDYFREKIRAEKEKEELAMTAAESMRKAIEDATAKHKGAPEKVRPIRGKKSMEAMA
jgi:hypothetical protein